MIPLLALALVVPQLGDIVIPPQAFAEIVCVDRTGITAGTAFRIGPGLMLSVNHVTSAKGQCFVGGKPMTIRYTSRATDFSMIGGGPEGPFLKVDCGGFVKGHSYLALGYARGLPELTRVELTANGEMYQGRAVLTGMFVVVPGQSGGPIIDKETGEVTGVVEAENFEEGTSWSIPLSATPACQAKS